MDAKTIELPPLDFKPRPFDQEGNWQRRAECREDQLLAALKSLSERDAQLAALQVTAEHSRERADGLLKDKSEGRELLIRARGLLTTLDSNNAGRIIDDIGTWLTRHPSPSVPTKEAQ